MTLVHTVVSSQLNPHRAYFEKSCKSLMTNINETMKLRLCIEFLAILYYYYLFFIIIMRVYSICFDILVHISFDLCDNVIGNHCFRLSFTQTVMYM